MGEPVWDGTAPGAEARVLGPGMPAGVKTQQRGPITDTFPVDAQGRIIGRATVSCVHGKTWPEGGYGCRPCMDEWRASRAAA